MTLADVFTAEPPPGWPADANISPWKLIGIRQAAADLDVSKKILLQLCAENDVMVVHLSARKVAILARDLVRLVQMRSRRA